HKELDPGDTLPCVVAVFPVKVSKLAKAYPEQSERRRKWFTSKKAAKLVDEPELAAMIKKFDPRMV
ncbi:MAG: NUDIX hydrolase, partial [Pseudomonadota bacterium]